MNKNLLRSKMIAVNEGMKDLAKLLNVSITSVSYRLNGHTEFTRTDIMKIKEHYHLTPEDIDLIFFNEKVS